MSNQNLGSCPCEHTTPCSDMCTCAHPFMSAGCRRCCSYGNPEQQLAAAEYLAKIIDAGVKQSPASPVTSSLTNRERFAQIVIDLDTECRELRDKVKEVEQLTKERDAFAVAAKTLYSLVFQCCGRDSLDELTPEAREALETIKNLSFPELVPTGCHFEANLLNSFSYRARLVMGLARQAAQEYCHGKVATEHILLGLLKEIENFPTAKLFLNQYNLTVTKVKSEIDRLVYSYPNGSAPILASKIPFTERAKTVLKYANEERQNLKSTLLEPEHLALGLLLEDQGIAAQILTNCGFDKAACRKAILFTLGC